MQTIQERVKNFIERVTTFEFASPLAKLRQNNRTSSQTMEEAPKFSVDEKREIAYAFGFVEDIFVSQVKCADGDIDYLEVRLNDKMGKQSTVYVQLGSSSSFKFVDALNGAKFSQPIEIESEEVGQYGYKLKPIYSGIESVSLRSPSGTRPLDESLAFLISDMRERLAIERPGHEQIYRAAKRRSATRVLVEGAGRISTTGFGNSAAESFDSVSGAVRDVEVFQRDGRGTEPTDMLRLTLFDHDSDSARGIRILVDVKLGGYFAAKLLGQLNAANLAHPISIEAAFVEGNAIGADVTNTILVRQNGQVIIPRYLDGKTDLPQPDDTVGADGAQTPGLELIRSESLSIARGLAANVAQIEGMRFAYAREQRLSAKKFKEEDSSFFSVSPEGQITKTDSEGAPLKRVESVTGNLLKAGAFSLREGNYDLRLELAGANDSTIFVDIPLRGQFGCDLVARLNAADLSEPITFESEMIDPQAPFLGQRLLVKQGGEVLGKVFADGLISLPRAASADDGGASIKAAEVFASTIEEIDAKLGALWDEDSAKSRSRYAERG